MLHLESRPRPVSLLAALAVLAGALGTQARAMQFGPPQTVPSSSVSYQAVAVDLDQDGDDDLLAAGLTGLSWNENTDGLGVFGPARPIAASSLAHSVFAADLDADGDPDVVAAWTTPTPRVAWYENLDGAGTFGPENPVTSGITGFRRIRDADLDSDGDPDVLVTSASGDRILWCPNTDGLGTFGPQVVIEATPSAAPYDAVAGDLDGDGDLDVLAALLGANRVAWYENTDGLGAFGPRQPITFCNQAQAVWAADVDGDGDLDALYGCGLVQVGWHENVDGQGTFAPGGIIYIGALGVNTVQAVDLDGDGDQDVLFTLPFTLGVIAAYLNDGQGKYSSLDFLPTTPPSLSSIATGDLNGDGAPDVISVGSDFVWYENVIAHAAVELVVPGSPPNPAALLPGATSGPVLGAVWDPVIDHTSFFPGAVVDLLGLSLSSVNVPLPPYGTLLCGPAILSLPSAPGLPFSVSIPPDPTLQGVSLCALGASADFTGTILLTNALQIEIGLY